MTTKRPSWRLGAILAAIASAAVLRWVPHPPNFTPIAAMALFSGAHLGQRPLAFLAPLGAMLLSDLVLGFHELMPFVYGSLALTVLIGCATSVRPSAIMIACTASLSAVLFFAVTNFGVWITGGYPKNFAGLLSSYIAGLPFFANTLASDLFYSAIFFGGFGILQRLVPVLGPQFKS